MDLLLPTSDKLTVHQEFTLKDDSGDEWQISAARIPNARGQLGVLILHSLRPARGQLLWLALFILHGRHPGPAAALDVFPGGSPGGCCAHGRQRPSQHLFVASASHELRRSPLSVILSAASALEHAPREKVPHFTAMIRKGQPDVPSDHRHADPGQF